MDLDPSTCQQIKDNGTQCQANKIHGSKFCFFHDPTKAAERTAARRAGGRVGKTVVLPEDTPAQRVKTAEDVVSLMSDTINQVRTGLLDPRVANCVGYLSGVVLKAIEQGDLEERLASLETIVSGQHRPRDLFDTDPAELVIEGEGNAGQERASA